MACRHAGRKDLEKYGYVRDDDAVELPEDRPGGKMLYFAGMRFLGAALSLNSVL